MAGLEGKVAVVTGGTRGIGLSIAGAIVDTGARVVVSGTSDAAAEVAAGLGSGALGVRADVRIEADVVELMRTAVGTFGGVDILVNNAGVGWFGSVEQTGLEAWTRVMDTNLTGAYLCTRHALPLMRARGGGWVINISSLSSTAPFADGAVYCASKAALNAFSESLMQEVRQDGIRVAAVLPGSVRTGFMGRSASGSEAADDDWKLSPDDVARAVLALLEHPARSLPSRVELRPARPPRRK